MSDRQFIALVALMTAQHLVLLLMIFASKHKIIKDISQLIERGKAEVHHG